MNEYQQTAVAGQRLPDAIVLDLGKQIASYDHSVQHLGEVLDVNPASMLSWLTCYISCRDYWELQLENAVCDIEMSIYDASMDPADIEGFSNAAMDLGAAVIDQLTQYGVFSPETGEFPYHFSALIGGRSALFERNRGYN